MELLDRYLQAVRKHLPWKRQDDILAELRANLESQLEDKESELGRPLNAAEADAWIRALGAPAQVALQYQPQQYLIGPAVFPMYLYVLRIAGAWATVIYLVANALTIALGSPSGVAIIQSAFNLLFVLLQVAAWVTLIFAILEYVAARHPGTILPSLAGFYGKWSPSSLPPLQPAGASTCKRRSYAQAVANVVFGFLFLGWLLIIPRHPFVLLGPGVFYLDSGPFRLAPIWITFYWWVVALNIVQLGWNCIELLRGTWDCPSRLLRSAVSLIGLAPLFLLVNVPGGALVLLKNPAADQARYATTLAQINHGAHVALLIVAAIVVVQLIIDIALMFSDSWKRRAAR
ncbi:MAG TPA: hypothetical protein VGG85_02210 [Terracidiphilus sp.]|jgi:hypothetical protein